MTPFGRRLRELRRSRKLSQKDMALALNVSAAYLSALEHGHRAAPSFDFVQRVTGYFNVIWDEAEELQRLARLSDPKISIDTSGLTPEATELANRLARRIATMDTVEIQGLLEAIKHTKP